MKEFKYLTKKDSENICQAVSDLANGNHLLYKRTDDKLKCINEVLAASFHVGCGEATEREKEIIEWFNACNDFDYARDNGYLDKNWKFIKIKWKEE